MRMALNHGLWKHFVANGALRLLFNFSLLCFSWTVLRIVIKVKLIVMQGVAVVIGLLSLCCWFLLRQVDRAYVSSLRPASLPPCSSSCPPLVCSAVLAWAAVETRWRQHFSLLTEGILCTTLADLSGVDYERRKSTARRCRAEQGYRATGMCCNYLTFVYSFPVHSYLINFRLSFRRTLPCINCSIFTKLVLLMVLSRNNTTGQEWNYSNNLTTL